MTERNTCSQNFSIDILKEVCSLYRYSNTTLSLIVSYKFIELCILDVSLKDVLTTYNFDKVRLKLICVLNFLSTSNFLFFSTIRIVFYRDFSLIKIPLHINDKRSTYFLLDVYGNLFIFCIKSFSEIVYQYKQKWD